MLDGTAESRPGCAWSQARGRLVIRRTAGPPGYGPAPGPRFNTPQEFLDRSDVVVILEEVGGEGVAKRVATDWLGDPRTKRGGLDCALKDGFMQVVAAVLASHPLDVDARRRKDPPPG